LALLPAVTSDPAGLVRFFEAFLLEFRVEDESQRQPLILTGASVRAAAESALRTGFAPWCVDQFGDVDTRRAAVCVRRVASWPEGMPEALDGFPEADWIYAGALENSPEVIEVVSRSRRLLGCSPDVLALIRDPFWLERVLKSCGLPALPVKGGRSIDGIRAIDGVPANEAMSGSAEEWLLKPFHSAAGMKVAGVGSWKHCGDRIGGATGKRSTDGSPVALNSAGLSECYLQKKAEGRVVSGLYLTDGRSVLLLGLCEQLQGEAASGAKGYLYCGSIGPLTGGDVSDAVFDQADRIGKTIVRAVAEESVLLRGLFGIDFVVDEVNERLWLLEVNPRYTASVEIYERIHGWPLIRWHADACSGQGLPEIRGNGGTFKPAPLRKAGRQVVYSPCDFVVGGDSEWSSVGVTSVGNGFCRDVDQDIGFAFSLPFEVIVGQWFGNLADRPNGSLAERSFETLAERLVDVLGESTHCRGGRDRGATSVFVADVPRPGTRIRKGEPVCTLLTESGSVSMCREVLASAARELRQRIVRQNESWR